MQPSPPPVGPGTDPRAIAAAVSAVVGVLVFGVILGLIATVLGWTAYQAAGADPTQVRSRRYALVGVLLGPLDVAAGIALLVWG